MTRETQTIGIQPTGYRLPDQGRVGGVRLQVNDLDVSLAFYTSILGFRVFSQDGTVAAVGPESGPALVELHERRGSRPVPRRGLVGLYHFAILMPDRAALGRFVAHLGETGSYAGSADHLVSEALYLSDPDGLGVEVCADRPRATWKTNGREIAMATQPLDLRALVSAAGGEPWTGMPSGTTIGHVHFHVSTLGEAEAFYHRALGFDKVVWSYPGAVFFSAGGYHHHVGTNIWAAGSAAAAPHDAQLLEWSLELPNASDVAAASENAAKTGYRVRLDGEDRLIADASGITVRLTQRSTV